MNTLGISHEQLLSIGKLNPAGFHEIRKRRRPYNRLGLLKGEEVHALTRQVAYGKQGKLTTRDLYEQKNTNS